MVTERLLSVADEAVKLALGQEADQAEALAFFVRSALTRYANSQIHQNVSTRRGGLIIRAVIGKRVGRLRVNSLEENQIHEAVDRVIKVVQVTPPNKDFKSLPKPRKWEPLAGTFDVKTAECTPDYRAERVREAIEEAHSTSPIVKAVAGSFSIDSITFAVANSLGVSASAQISSTSLNTTVISKKGNSQGFGSAEQYSRKIKDIEPVRIGREAAEKSANSVNPQKISPGEFEVVLPPRAIASLLMYLGYIGFSATTYQDGQSFVKYNLNKQVFDEKLDVEDDPRNLATLYALPIDGEGTPKQKMQLIKAGKVSKQSICYDSFTAGKEKNQQSTGHTFPPVYGFYGRPMPFNILVGQGDSSIEEMIKETRHGLFITRFHYTNPVEPTKAILTGLTRDGTFLIENGEITKPVVNLRYTDSMLSALKEIPYVGKKTEMVDEVTTPAVKLQKLRFTGITQY